MNKEELKNCPFCGSEAIKGMCVVWCENDTCIANSISNIGVFETSEEAVKAWNTRPTENVSEGDKEHLRNLVFVELANQNGGKSAEELQRNNVAFTPIYLEMFGISVAEKVYKHYQSNGDERLIEALEEIAKGEGRYDTDKLKHASNTIENMKGIAIKVLAEYKQALTSNQQ